MKSIFNDVLLKIYCTVLGFFQFISPKNWFSNIIRAYNKVLSNQRNYGKCLKWYSILSMLYEIWWSYIYSLIVRKAFTECILINHPKRSLLSLYDWKPNFASKLSMSSKYLRLPTTAFSLISVVMMCVWFSKRRKNIEYITTVCYHSCHPTCRYQVRHDNILNASVRIYTY